MSTQEQAEQGVSLAAQEQAIGAYCTMRGLELGELVRDEGVSAGKPLADRPGGQRVLVQLRRRGGPTAVVAMKLDRLFRDCSDCLNVVRTWDRAGVSLHLIDLGGQAVDTSSAMGRFFLTVMAGAAELERNQVGERTSAAMRHMQAAGQYTGGHLPFGFRLAADGAHLVEHEQEQETLRLIRQLRAEGQTFRAICAELERRGIKTRAGSSWNPGTVKRLVVVA